MLTGMQSARAVGNVSHPAAQGPLDARGHLRALDGLRGVAVAGVVLFHTGLLPGGFLGVDLFFVLSGYLITGLLLREAREAGKPSLGAFWARRVRRLVPALVLMLVIVTLVTWAAAPADVVRSTLSDGPWVQASLQNWHLVAESSSYWDRFATVRVFEHLWSIAVEEQFYLVWPILVLAIVTRCRRSDWAVLLTAGVLSAVSLAVMVTLFDPADPTRVYIGTDTRAFSLLLGALVSTAPVRQAVARLSTRWRDALTALFAGLLVVVWAVADGQDSPWLFGGGLFTHAALAAGLVSLCAATPGAVLSRALACSPVRWLGLVSYGVYLWHWPVIAWLSTGSMSLHGWRLTLVVATISIAIAAVSRRLVEDPIRYRARWSRGRVGLAALVAAMVSLGLMWALLPMPVATRIDVTGFG